MKRNRSCLPLAASIFVLFSSLAVAAQPSVPVSIIKAERLLDPRTGNVLSPAAVLIEGGKVKTVGSPAEVQSYAPTSVQTIDLGNSTLLPGLIDGHTHLFLDVVVPPEEESKRRENGKFVPALLLAIVESPIKRAFLGAQMAQEDLESGITTVRNLGHSGIDGDTELRDAIDAGRVPGPRILASARKLITRGEYVQNLNPALAESILREEFLLIDGPESARKAVRQNVFQHVDVIKVSADENLTVPELTAAVQEAHRNHLKIAVHAIDKTAIQTAIDSGADSIEHGNEATDAQLKQMRDKGIFIDLTPTSYNHFLLKITEPSIVLSPTSRSARAIADAHHDQLYDQLIQRVLRSRVKFAAGTDMCWFWPGKTCGQASITTILNLHAAGMSALDVIRAVTTNAAEMLGWQDKIGAIDAGKFADLIAVKGDPVADITELERVGFVMKNGEVIRNDLGRIEVTPRVSP